jgi:hypothetical protein
VQCTCSRVGKGARAPKWALLALVTMLADINWAKASATNKTLAGFAQTLRKFSLGERFLQVTQSLAQEDMAADGIIDVACHVDCNLQFDKAGLFRLLIPSRLNYRSKGRMPTEVTEIHSAHFLDLQKTKPGTNTRGRRWSRNGAGQPNWHSQNRFGFS